MRRLLQRLLEPVFYALIFGLLTFLELRSTNYVVSTISFIKIGFICSLLLVAKPSRSTNWSLISLVGIVLSFGAVFFFDFNADGLSKLLLTLSLTNILFYCVFVLYAFISLGRSFAITAVSKELKTEGPYSILRHPLYSAYLHIAATGVIISPSWNNLLCFLFFYLGLILRIREEEKVLSRDNSYDEYRRRVKNCLIHPILSIPVLILGIFSVIFLPTGSYSIQKSKPIKLMLSYPVLNLNPLFYDDFGSVFVGNHIYRRLFPDPSRAELLSVAEKPEIFCSNRKGRDCKTLKISAPIKPLSNCAGRVLSIEEVKAEVEQLLLRKRWILPNFKFCKTSAQNVLCLEAPFQVDVERNILALYLRIGWSGAEKLPVGTGPYCLTRSERSDEGIVSGRLDPHPDSKNLPPIDFFLGSSNSDYSIALYGAPSPGQNYKINLDTQTPIAYYVVSNPKKAKDGARLIWNQKVTRNLISEFFVERKFAVENSKILEQQVPNGNALIESSRVEMQTKDDAKIPFMLPAYIDDCKVLEERVNRLWGYTGAKCGNTSALIESIQKGEQVEWSGLLSPLTPGAPGRSAISLQYFSPLSSESWTGQETHPDKFFYLAAMGKALIGVDSREVCGLRPNPLGLGDLMISDFKFCN